MAKWRRLWQPGRLLFWQMLVFNMLSSACAWAMNTLPLNGIGLALIGTLGVLNVAFGMLAAWMLVKEEPK
jgi:hypothetical protein